MGLINKLIFHLKYGLSYGNLILEERLMKFPLLCSVWLSLFVPTFQKTGSFSSVVCMPFAGKPEAEALGAHLVSQVQNANHSGTIAGEITEDKCVEHFLI